MLVTALMVSEENDEENGEVVMSEGSAKSKELSGEASVEAR